MSNFKFPLKCPKIGARIFKSSLAVFICLIIGPIFGKEPSVISASTALLCMQNSITDSLKTGEHRVLGTILGSVLALITNAFIGTFNSNYFIKSIIISIGILVVIYACVCLDIKGAIIIASVVYLGVTAQINSSNWLIYSINRIADTFIGVFIGIFINKSILKKSFDNVEI